MSIPDTIRDVQAKARCLYTHAEIQQALDKMAKDIHSAVGDQNPILLCVMVGGLIPAGNLLPRLDFPLEVDYIHATRYGNKTRGGEVRWLVKPRLDLKDRVVLIVDDILDGGITLAEIKDYCLQAGAAKVLVAVLLDKSEARLEKGLPFADFVGLSVENGFLFGYGMDYQEYLRNAPGIYVVAPEHQ